MDIEEAIRLRQEAGGLNKLMNIRIVSVNANGGAEVEATLGESLLNPLGIAHGGTVYTLCDVAAGSAAASGGRIAVTLGSSINYYRPGLAGTRLTAVAAERKHGRNVSVYFVEVRDENGRQIADATFTMFYNGVSIDGEAL